MSNHEIKFIGNLFYILFPFAKGNNRFLVDKIDFDRIGSSSVKVAVEMSILVGSSTHLHILCTGWSGGSDIDINRVTSVILNRRSQVFMVRYFYT
jgi:hypothetical protein